MYKNTSIYKRESKKKYRSASSSSIFMYYTRVDIFVAIHIQRRVLTRPCALDCRLRKDPDLFLSATLAHQHKK